MKPVIFAAVLLGLACPGYCQTNSVQDNQSTPTVVVPQIVKSAGVWAIVTSDKQDYQNGGNVTLSLTLTNHSKSAVNYEFDSNKRYDFVISDSLGNVVWRWSQSRVFGSFIHTLKLSPDQSVTYHVIWNQRDNSDHPVAPGIYNVSAMLLPMARVEVTGNVISNTNNDPVNTGMPTSDSVQTGAVNLKNTTPPLTAKTTFKIEAAGT